MIEIRKLKECIIKSILLIKKDNCVLYINGTDKLPAPLSTEEETLILHDFYENPECEEKEKNRIRNLLIERNLRLVVFLAKKFDNTGAGLEDMISIGTIGLIKAISTFRPDKNIKLATYASRCIENEILMYIRKNSGNHTEISIDEPLNIDWDGNELLLSDVLGNEEDSVSENLEREEDKKIIQEAIAGLSERERMIIDLRFGLSESHGHERTQKEVADMLGISQSYISRLEKKIIRELKSEISGKL